MMHATIQCGIVPSRNRLMFQQVLVTHFNVARCIVSIIANTSLVSETLLTKRAILSDAYMYSTCSYCTIM